MTIFLLFVQIGLPAMLLGWLATYPASGRAAYTLHAAATGSVILALGLVGLWVMPPWWVPSPLPLACSGRVKL